MSQKVQAEREAERTRLREEREEAEFERARRLKEKYEHDTLLELMTKDDNPEAARDKVRNEVYHWMLASDLMACYLHTEHGCEPPMMFDEEKRRLKEATPNFKVPLKIESDM